MFEKEIDFALNNEWVIGNFILKMIDGNERFRGLKDEEETIIRQILPQKYKKSFIFYTKNFYDYIRHLEKFSKEYF